MCPECGNAHSSKSCERLAVITRLKVARDTLANHGTFPTGSNAHPGWGYTFQPATVSGVFTNAGSTYAANTSYTVTYPTPDVKTLLDNLIESLDSLELLDSE